MQNKKGKNEGVASVFLRGDGHKWLC